MTLFAGNLEPNGELTDGSMAQEIERALEDLVPLGVKEDPLGRRKLVLAIARGVLKHLHDQIGSVQVQVPNSIAPTHPQSATVAVDLGAWS